MPASEDFTPLDTLKRYLVQDQYRPLGNDPWTNTMRGTAPAPGQGFSPTDPVLYRTASPLVNITEGDIGRATDVALGASGGGLKGQQIKAYHSSPHDFDKFDLSKIGTGEGAQVYGHGLYFAENPAVSGQGGQYWDQFVSRFGGPESIAAKELQFHGFDRAKAAENMRSRIMYPDEALPKDVLDRQLALRQEALKHLEGDKPVGPRTYEVNINADPAHMLDWDKRFFGQSPEVQDRLRRIGINPPETALPGQFSPAGSEIYRSLGDKVAASERLGEAGIPGIKYLDEGSRPIAGQISMRQRMLADPNLSPTMKAQAAEELAAWQAEKPTSNYVVRDPSILDIVKKYGLAGLASVPALTSLRDRENQP